MVNFANPKLLYLLAAVPVFALLYWRMRYLRCSRIAKFGNPAVLDSLMPDVSKYLPTVKIVVALIAITSMCFMLARPRTHGVATEEEVSGIEVMIAVDVSNSMLASSTDDPRGVSRLQRAKHVLNSLLGKLDNDRVGLIVFAGDAFTQLPLTPDFVSAKLYLNEISTGMVENQGTDIGSAIQVAMNSFSGMKDVERAIIVITDAEDQVGDAVSVAKAAHDEGIEIDVIGLGSGKGAQIPLDRSYTNWLKDENGMVVTTFLNEQLAQEVAEAGGGVYINGASASALNELAQRLDEIKKTNFGRVNYTANDEQFPIFAWIALVMIIIDCIFSNRKIGFLRKYNFFSRASVVALLLAFGFSVDAAAPKAPLLDYPDNSMRPERQFIREGNEQFKAGHYREAEILYARALNANPTSEVGLYNQALTRLHLSGDNAEQNQELKQNALQTMQNLVKAQNPTVAEYAAYNLGNIAYESQQLQQALECYKQSLRINPANEQARENYRFVEKKIQDQQQNQDQNQQQEQEQQQQQQDQQQQDQQQQEQQQDQQQQDQQQNQQQEQQQKEQNISQSNREQILNAVEKKDAAARARAKGDPSKGGGQRNHGKNW